MIDYKKLSEDVEKFRQEHGLSYERTGMMLGGVSGTTTKRIIDGDNTVTHKTKVRVYQALRDKGMMEETEETQEIETDIIDYIKSKAKEVVEIDKVIKLFNSISGCDSWICCKDELPEECHEGKYKNTYSDYVNVTVQFPNGSRRVYGSKLFNGRWAIESKYDCKVIAWMPLPEAYEE